AHRPRPCEIPTWPPLQATKTRRSTARRSRVSETWHCPAYNSDAGVFHCGRRLCRIMFADARAPSEGGAFTKGRPRSPAAGSGVVLSGRRRCRVGPARWAHRTQSDRGARVPRCTYLEVLEEALASGSL